MKVWQLVQMLSNPEIQDHYVLISEDSEGNGFKKPAVLSFEMMDDPTRYSPEMDEEGVETVVIWP